jgi:hypothetical protein
LYFCYDGIILNRICFEIKNATFIFDFDEKDFFSYDNQYSNSEEIIYPYFDPVSLTDTIEYIKIISLFS